MRLRYDLAPLAHVVDDFEGDTSERLAGGVRLSAVADPNPEDEPLVYIHAFAVRRRTPKTDPALLCIYNGRPHQPLLWVKAGKYWHAARLETDRKRLLSRSGGCVRAARDKDGFQFYARVYHFRKWLLLLPLLLAALLLCLSLTLCGSRSTSPDFIAGMTGTAGATPKQVVSVDYAAYDASVDSAWKADSLTQDFTLSLPATCKYAKGKEGGNPIISSPSIMVDLNHDGKYDSDTECVYNAPDKTGYGAFIRPGCEVNRIKLTQSVPADTYSARTVWRSLLASDGKTPASSTSFDFNLTVE